ncbi:hypothetical protein D3C80_705750 [compost metagenome]
MRREVGLFFAQREGDGLALRQGLGQRRRLGVVEVQHRRCRPPDEAAEQVAQLLHRLVVQRDVGHDRHGRVIAGDRAVRLVHLGHEEVWPADKRAGEGMIRVGEILHHRAVDHGGLAARLIQNPGDHAGDGRLAAGARHPDRGRGGVEQFAQQLGPGLDDGADAPGRADVGHRVLDRPGGDDDLIRACHARPVLRMQGDAVGAQPVELVRRPALIQRPVRARDAVPLRLNDHGQGQHAGPADAAEEIVFVHRLDFDARNRGMSERLTSTGDAGGQPHHPLCTLQARSF